MLYTNVLIWTFVVNVFFIVEINFKLEVSNADVAEMINEIRFSLINSLSTIFDVDAANWVDFLSDVEVIDEVEAVKVDDTKQNCLINMKF